MSMKRNKDKYNSIKYLHELSKKILADEKNIHNLKVIKKILLKTKKNKKKVFIFGNGGSSSIASHFAIDLINKTKIRCLNFSDNSLLSCFSNDYGFDNWIRNVLEIFLDRDDVIIFISSSGRSMNMINGINYAKKKKIKNLITFTGGNKNNPLSKKGKLNIWVNSHIYNYVENTHQIWLLSIIDSIKLNKIKKL